MSKEAKKKVLVIDDELEILELYFEIFSSQGHEVQTAHDGALGYHKARREKFDLICTDFRMPELTGIELIKALRENEFNKNTPIFLISAFVGEFSEQVKNVSDLSIFSKPINPNELIEKAKTAIAATGKTSTNQTPSSTAVMDPFKRAMENTLKSFWGVKSITSSKTEVQETLKDFNATISCQYPIVSEKLNGNLILNFSKESFLRFASAITDENLKNIDPACEKVAAELTNIVISKTKDIFSSKGIHLQKTSPLIIHGEGHQLVNFSEGLNFNCEFRTDLGELGMQLFLSLA